MVTVVYCKGALLYIPLWIALVWFRSDFNVHLPPFGFACKCLHISHIYLLDLVNGKNLSAWKTQGDLPDNTTWEEDGCIGGWEQELLW